MRFEISCQCCERGIERTDESDEPDTTVDCECGARYAVTVSLLRRP